MKAESAEASSTAFWTDGIVVKKSQFSCQKKNAFDILCENFKRKVECRYEVAKV